MPRWRATVTYLTIAGGIRTWESELEADTAEAACEAAMRAARLERRHSIDEITDTWVECVAE